MAETSRAGSWRPDDVDGDVVLDHLAHAVLVTAADGTIIGWNGGAEELLGWDRATMVGTSVIDLMAPEERPRVHEAIARRRQGDTSQAEWLMRSEGGDPKHIVVDTRPVRDDAGEVVALVASLTDVDRVIALEATTHELSDRLRKALLDSMESVALERQHRERLEFLGRLNEMLATTSSRADVMVGLTEMAVPRLGDWCAVYVVPDPERPVDRQQLDVSTSLGGRPGSDTFEPVQLSGAAFDAEATAWQVITSDRTSFLPTIEPDAVDPAGTAPDPAEPGDADRSPTSPVAVPRSAITVPLRKRGRVVGAIQVIRTAAERRYLELDVSLVETAAARVAASLENLRLVEQRTHVARTLQSGLLPQAIPKFEGLDIVGRYRSASEGLAVGGDFYDVFELGDGSLGLTVGDVCGKGAEAATVTALARDSIRMSAWHGDRPCEVLDWLNLALIRMDQQVSATAAYGTIRVDGPTAHLVVASCGHPLPLVVRRDHSVAQVGHHGTILGIFPDARCVESGIELETGDAIVLFTDGITDVPPPHDLSDDALMEMVGNAHRTTISADEMADHLLAAVDEVLPISQRNDDIALVVLRIT